VPVRPVCPVSCGCGLACSSLRFGKQEGNIPLHLAILGDWTLLPMPLLLLQLLLLHLLGGDSLAMRD
jgi:hypothetical protein